MTQWNIFNNMHHNGHLCALINTPKDIEQLLAWSNNFKILSLLLYSRVHVFTIFSRHYPCAYFLWSFEDHAYCNYRQRIIIRKVKYAHSTEVLTPIF